MSGTLEFLNKEQPRSSENESDTSRRLDKSSQSYWAHELISLVEALHGSHTLCDLIISVDGDAFTCHKFVLKARSFAFPENSCTNELVIDNVRSSVFRLVYDWMYRDVLPPVIDDTSLLEVAEVSMRFGLNRLTNICESLLHTRLDLANCIRFYDFAESNSLEILRKECADLVKTRWDDFYKNDFDSLSATVLYRLLKSNSSNVIRSIIELDRGDVFFLFAGENESNLKNILNDPMICPGPLELALNMNYFSLASELIKHGANVHLLYKGSENTTLLMNVIRSGNARACKFLLDHGCVLTGIQDFHRNITPIQEIAQSSLSDSMFEWIRSVISTCDFNDISSSSLGSSGCQMPALSLACVNVDDRARQLVPLLLDAGADPNLCDLNGKTALYHALLTRVDFVIAKQLIESGANIDQLVDGDPLIHCMLPNLKSFEFLLNFSPKLNVKDGKGVPLPHAIVNRLSIEKNIPECISIFKRVSELHFDVNGINDAGDTLLHHAIRTRSPLLETIISCATDIDFGRRDSNGATVLELTIDLNMFDTAEMLVKKGADVDVLDSAGYPLLLSSLQEGHDAAALFLLRHKANYKIRNEARQSCLEIALSLGLADTIRELCGSGLNLNERSICGSGFGVLERALSAGHIDCADILVSYGCDVESWTVVDGIEQTLLHHMLAKRNEAAAMFLIESGCDVNSLRRFENSSDDDKFSPLHLAVLWGLNDVVRSLVGKGALLIAQDCDGRTPCHIAVREGNFEALDSLLSASDVSFIGTRDKLGQTPLSLAISRRDHRVAASIVNRLPHAALQTNGNGENLLHVAVRSNDLESVLFLLGTHTDPTRTIVDASRKTALHLASHAQDELIMRNLILAGCVVDARSTDGRTPLHEACIAHRPDLVTILLENEANINIADEKGDTALVTAVRFGGVSCVKVLLAHGSVDLRAVNKKGSTCLHVCASLTSEKMETGTNPADVCDLIISAARNCLSAKDLPIFIDAQDSLGNTALLLAYQLGNAAVCRSLLKAAASMGVRNNEGVTIFTHETPTKQLLFGLLETLICEPRWSEAVSCDCGAKFSIAHRKHHCRHCGRVVCAPCSSISMPIIKFGEEKKVRVCNLCSLVLTQRCPA